MDACRCVEVEMVRTRILGLMFIAALIGSDVVAQQGVSGCTTVEYGNRNQVDPKPLSIRTLSGKVSGVPGKLDLGPIPGACLGLFTETDHRLIASVAADDSGRFRFARISPGQYRLVARDPQNVLCLANVRVRIVDWPRGGTLRAKHIIVHLRPAGIDRCSYADYK
jgi:hypothetical protein